MRRFTIPGPLRAVAALAAAAGLAGCISLLPKAQPVQLYQFGDGAAPAAAAARAGEAAPVGVALGVIAFPQAATSDQILTVTGNDVAYIKGARWAAPASVLFQEDTTRAFDRLARSVRLLQRSELGTARAVLRLDVHDFEVRYEGGAPVIVVAVRASLSRAGGEVLADRTFDVRQPAAENRVSAIVAAFDQATAQALQQIVGWTDALAPSIPPRDLGATPPLVTTNTTRTSTPTTARPRG